LVLLMAVERLGAVAETLIRNGRPADTPVSVTADGTLPTQRTIVATLDTVASRVLENGIRPPAVVVIGEVVNIAAEIAELTRALPRVVPGPPGAAPAPAHPGTAPA
jgi:uroporphyrin-III C-methyltransferase / precorrin-2 dehydrogenase / sirohydrochlorin ferrochelatase